jgi:uncharacterized protein YdhG (YjbR/CyaY superfamily)
MTAEQVLSHILPPLAAGDRSPVTVRVVPDSTRKVKRMEKAASVSDYLARLPKDQRIALQALRRTIKAATPEAVELVSYGMPAFKHKGILAYYAAFRDHCSFFPASVAVMRKFARELKGYGTTGKGTIHFTPDKPLPARLVTRIIKARVAENEARQAARQARKRKA